MAETRLPIEPKAVYGVLKELRREAAEERQLAVGGARALAAGLRKELARGGVASAIREGGDPEGAAALVYVLAGDVTEEDERALRAASRARVPIVCVLTGPAVEEARPIPYVLAENVVRVGGGVGFPLDEIARALARSIGERGTPLAARLPMLRRAVCSHLIGTISRQNALVGVAAFVPGADLPALTLNQIRLVLRIADAHGFEIDRERLPEVVGVIGSGLGFRAVARQALGFVPIAGWALKGAVAYAGTRTLGEAAVRYFEARAPVTRVAGARTLFPR